MTGDKKDPEYAKNRNFNNQWRKKEAMLKSNLETNKYFEQFDSKKKSKKNNNQSPLNIGNQNIIGQKVINHQGEGPKDMSQDKISRDSKISQISQKVISGVSNMYQKTSQFKHRMFKAASASKKDGLQPGAEVTDFNEHIKRNMQNITELLEEDLKKHEGMTQFKKDHQDGWVWRYLSELKKSEWDLNEYLSFYGGNMNRQIPEEEYRYLVAEGEKLFGQIRAQKGLEILRILKNQEKYDVLCEEGQDQEVIQEALNQIWQEFSQWGFSQLEVQEFVELIRIYRQEFVIKPDTSKSEQTSSNLIKSMESMSIDQNEQNIQEQDVKAQPEERKMTSEEQERQNQKLQSEIQQVSLLGGLRSVNANIQNQQNITPQGKTQQDVIKEQQELIKFYENNRKKDTQDEQMEANDGKWNKSEYSMQKSEERYNTSMRLYGDYVNAIKEGVREKNLKWLSSQEWSKIFKQMDLSSLEKDFNHDQIATIKDCVLKTIFQEQEIETDKYLQVLLQKLEYQIQNGSSSMMVKDQIKQEAINHLQSKAGTNFAFIFMKQLEQSIINYELLGEKEEMRSIKSEDKVMSYQGSVNSKTKFSPISVTVVEEDIEIKIDQSTETQLKIDIRELMNNLKCYPDDLGEALKLMIEKKYQNVEEGQMNQIILDGLDIYRVFLNQKLKATANQYFSKIKEKVKSNEKINTSIRNGYLNNLGVRFLNVYTQKQRDKVCEMIQTDIEIWNKKVQDILRKEEEYEKERKKGVAIKRVQFEKENENTRSSKNENFMKSGFHQGQKSNSIVYNQKEQLEKQIKYDGERPQKNSYSNNNQKPKQKETDFKFKKDISKLNKNQKAKVIQANMSTAQQKINDKFDILIDQINRSKRQQLDDQELERKRKQMLTEDGAAAYLQNKWDALSQEEPGEWFYWRILALEYEKWLEFIQNENQVPQMEQTYTLNILYYLERDQMCTITEQDKQIMLDIKKVIQEDKAEATLTRMKQKVRQWEIILNNNPMILNLRKNIFVIRESMLEEQQKKEQIQKLINDWNLKNMQQVECEWRVKVDEAIIDMHTEFQRRKRAIIDKQVELQQRQEKLNQMKQEYINLRMQNEQKSQQIQSKSQEIFDKQQAGRQIYQMKQIQNDDLTNCMFSTNFDNENVTLQQNQMQMNIQHGEQNNHDFNQNQNQEIKTNEIKANQIDLSEVELEELVKILNLDNDKQNQMEQEIRNLEKQIQENKILDLEEQRKQDLSQQQFQKVLEQYEEKIKSDLARRLRQQQIEEDTMTFSMSGWAKNEKFLNWTSNLIITKTNEITEVKVIWNSNEKDWLEDRSKIQFKSKEKYKPYLQQDLQILEKLRINNPIPQAVNFLLSYQRQKITLNISAWIFLSIVSFMEEMSLAHIAISSAANLLENNLKAILYKTSNQNDQDQDYQHAMTEIKMLLKRFKEWLREQGGSHEVSNGNMKIWIYEQFGIGANQNQIFNCDEEYGIVVEGWEGIKRVKDLTEIKQEFLMNQMSKYFSYDQNNVQQVIARRVPESDTYHNERPMHQHKDDIGRQKLLVEERQLHADLLEEEEWLRMEKDLPILNTIYEKTKIRNKVMKAYKANNMSVQLNTLQWNKVVDGVENNETLLEQIVANETLEDALLCRQWLLRQTNCCMEHLWGRCQNLDCREHHDDNAKGILLQIMREKLKYNKTLKQNELNKTQPLKKLQYGDFENLTRDNNNKTCSNFILRLDEQQQRNLIKYVQEENTKESGIIDLKIVELIQNMVEVGNWSCHSQENIETLLECVYSQYQNVNLKRKDDQRWSKASIFVRRSSQIKIMQLQFAFLICQTLMWQNSSQRISEEEKLCLTQNIAVDIHEIDMEEEQNKMHLIIWRHHYIIAWMQAINKFVNNQKDIQRRGHEYLDWDLNNETMQVNILANLQNLEANAQSNFIKIYERDDIMNKAVWVPNLGNWLNQLGGEILMLGMQRDIFSNLNRLDYVTAEERLQRKLEYARLRNQDPTSVDGNLKCEIFKIGENKTSIWRNLMYRSCAIPHKQFWQILAQAGNEYDKMGWDWFSEESTSILIENHIQLIDYTNSLRVVKIDQKQTIDLLLEILEQWNVFQPDFFENNALDRFKDIIINKIITPLNMQNTDRHQVRVVLPFEWADELPADSKFKMKQNDQILPNIIEQLKHYEKQIVQEWMRIAKETNDAVVEDELDQWRIPLTNMRNIQKSIKRQKFQNTKVDLAKSWIQGFNMDLNVKTAQQIIQQLSTGTQLNLPPVFNVNSIIRIQTQQGVCWIDNKKINQFQESANAWEQLRTKIKDINQTLEALDQRKKIVNQGTILRKIQ